MACINEEEGKLGNNIVGFEFLADYRRAAKDFRTSKPASVAWQAVYMELMQSLTKLLLAIAINADIQKARNDKHLTLGRLRHYIGEQNILPSVLFQSLDVLILHRNILVHSTGYNFDAEDYLPDLDAVGNLILWYLSYFEFGPQISRKEAEKVLDFDKDIEELLCDNSEITIFISYAREDHAVAAQVYQFLSDYGYKPWMDKKDLIAGQTWMDEVRKAIVTSQFFVALMSEKSLGKRGYVQKEIRFALDVLGEIPPGQIYFIPVRLDECEIPDPIRRLHWIDLYESNDLKELISAINYQKNIEP